MWRGSADQRLLGSIVPHSKRLEGSCLWIASKASRPARHDQLGFSELSQSGQDVEKDRTEPEIENGESSFVEEVVEEEPEVEEDEKKMRDEAATRSIIDSPTAENWH